MKSQMALVILVASVSLTLGVANIKLAGAASFTGLGDLAGGFWRSDSADGNVVVDTTARFSLPDPYVMRLIAYDGARTSSDESTVTVNPSLSDEQTTTRVSVNLQGGDPNGLSASPQISADGRYVAFSSDASNLVAGDTNAWFDVFVHDRQTGQTSRVSVATGGQQGNDHSSVSSLSADGRYVVFVSGASNLVSGDTNAWSDVFVHDRQTGQTSRVSVATDGEEGNHFSVTATISADGRYVAFDSAASNLVAGDTNVSTDVFVHDRQTGQTSRVSVATGGEQGNGASEVATISENGRFVAFQSRATNLVASDTNVRYDVFVHDRQTGQTSRMSVATDGTQGNEESRGPAISGNGRFVAFQSLASNLVAGDTNLSYDVYVRDRGPTIGSVPPNSDLNGDGKGDILWRNTSTTVVAAWLMDGTSMLLPGFLGGVPAGWKIEGIGDVDVDGKADVIWQHDSGVVAIWLMNGLSISSVGFPGGISLDWQIEEVGDVDGDGKADLLWRNTTSGVVAIWLMNGTTIATSGVLAGVPAGWQIAGLGDVNGDGKADVIWQHAITGTVAVWLMNGLSIMSVGFPASTSTDWQIKGVGDVNGDGREDLFWRHTTRGVVVVWFMNGVTIASSGVVGGLASNVDIEQVGDTNGDGKADVVLMNKTTGAVEVWLMDGLTIVSVGSPGTVSTDWEIQP